jgi:hypothetical protein
VPLHKSDQIFLRDPPTLTYPQTLQFTSAQPLINRSAIHFEPRRNLFWGVEIWQAHFLDLPGNTSIQSGRREILIFDPRALLQPRA